MRARDCGTVRRALPGRILSRLVPVAAVAFLGLGWLAPPAGAADAEGCSATATARDRTGAAIGHLAAPGAGGTHDDPLVLDPFGSVDWSYQLDSPISAGHWEARVGGLLPLKFGGDIKGGTKTADSGTEELRKNFVKKLPLFGETSLVTGLLYIEVEATGTNGGRCLVQAWISIPTSPWKTPLFYAGLGSILFGSVLVAGAIPRPL